MRPGVLGDAANRDAGASPSRATPRLGKRKLAEVGAQQTLDLLGVRLMHILLCLQKMRQNLLTGTNGPVALCECITSKAEMRQLTLACDPEPLLLCLVHVSFDETVCSEAVSTAPNASALLTSGALSRCQTAVTRPRRALRRLKR